MPLLHKDGKQWCVAGLGLQQQ
ncbi:KxYKxGKxW signal peptide domain-containing protein [Rheinheimera tilapiae]|uniref:KxYKxGKxW signal peptide domain-containing protein n=1 Tax=Rheinheimera tilapiae TaxID=875043 RepID=A0ABV6BCN3_9GAMM